MHLAHAKPRPGTSCPPRRSSAPTSYASGGLTTGASQINFAAAADLFNSLIAMFLVLGANFISRRVSDTSLF
ncbi:MAG: hypothetical protein MZU97_26505 [Bacillus subtilis]|nr:hypothetical protein [Bacillus subtilis]